MTEPRPALSVHYLQATPPAEPMPDEYSARHLGRGALILAAVGAAVIAAVVLLPGLGSLRDTFSEARPEWLAVAGVLELLSCLSYVLVFRGVFCRLMRRLTSYEIATAELGANSLLSVGGIGGLALGAWILRRGGMRASQIARRTVAFFLLTSLANVGALAIAGVGLWAGALNGSSKTALTLLPAAVGLGAIAAVLAVGSLSRRLIGRVRRPRVAAVLRSLSGGIEEALSLLRAGDWLVVVGAIGYMVFDIAMLGACFRVFGNEVPPGGVLVIAYLIGQLGGLIPIPGGIGGVDAGLIGALVLYGVGLTEATAAVLAYRAIVLWLPVALGAPSLVSLRRRLRSEAHDIAACAPGGEVEVLGRGRVTMAGPAGT